MSSSPVHTPTAAAGSARRSAALPVHVRAISSLGEGALMRISELADISDLERLPIKKDESPYSPN